ncbi:MAG: Radical domain protein [Holophagaceae bacterium]|nr:Radical domain protein [Holophagaceae bacterium]
MARALLLVHGYTGSPGCLGTLREALRNLLPPDVQVLCPTLPGHGRADVMAGFPSHHVGVKGGTQSKRSERAVPPFMAEPPPFDLEAFRQTLLEAAAPFTDLVILGHSTGGCLALDLLRHSNISPRLLILAATPRKLGPQDAARWEAHRRGQVSPGLMEVARMVRLIQTEGAAPLPWNTLSLQGDEDALVDPATRWEGALVRRVRVPGAGHELFSGPGSAFALDVALRALRDCFAEGAPQQTELARRLPEAAAFLGTPQGRHLAQCPSAARFMERDCSFPDQPDWEPAFANIEITTRCHLACPHCARQWNPRSPEDMPLERFERILDLLPQAWRITLVGLGETLLHPGLEAFIGAAKARKRQVGLVTSAQLLDPERGRALAEAGLDAITFSLDAVDPELLQRVRPGSRLDLILANIRAFSVHAAVTRAVFTAVSRETAPHLESLAETVSSLGVQAWMLSDLNFKGNEAKALRGHLDSPLRQAVSRAVRLAFARGVPALTVRGLEDLAPALSYRERLMIPPDQLFLRSEHHTHCLSPWQTLPVAVNGTLTLCDCQPEAPVGNLLEEPFTPLWERAWADHRRRMRQEPPEVCLGCPRF